MVKIAALFPGQGSQAVGMGRSAYQASAKAQDLYDKADQLLGFSLSKIMFEGPEEKLRETSITQPALFMASAAALEVLKEKGVKEFSWAAGHSLGEYSALYAARVVTFENALRLVQARGTAMQEAAVSQPGSMAAIIGLAGSAVRDICQNASHGENICVPANFNSESQIVISGHSPAVSRAMELATLAGAAKVVALNVSGAFHSPLMSSAAKRMESLIYNTSFSSAAFPVITNRDAQPTTEGSAFKQKLVEQIDHAVLWDQSLKLLLQMGIETVIEAGPGRVLGTMIKKLDRKKTVLFTDDLESLEKNLLIRKI